MHNTSHSAGALVGMILTRIAVPAWVALGAVVKLVETDPATLPGRTIAPAVRALPWDPVLTLAAIVGLELTAVAVMLTVAPLARATAMGILATYCAVLFGELAQGGTTASSGCLGSWSPAPVVMLVVNGVLLLAVLLFDPTEMIRASTYNLARAVAIVLAVAGFVVSFKVAINAGKADRNMVEKDDADAGSSATLQLNLATPATAMPSRR